MPPFASAFVAASMPMLPEQYTMPLYLMACENCGRGAGEFCVETASLVGDMAMWCVVCLIRLDGYCELLVSKWMKGMKGW